MKRLIYRVTRLPFQILYGIWFVFVYTRIKFRANLQVAAEVFKPSSKFQPGIIAYPLEVQGDFEIFLLSGLLTMIPATLSVDLSKDNQILYIHALFLGDAEKFLSEVRRDLEIPIREFCK